MPVWGSHTRPPLQPPSAHWVAGLEMLKSQSRRAYMPKISVCPSKLRVLRGRTQIRPAFQLFGTVKVTWVYAAASHLTTGFSGGKR